MVYLVCKSHKGIIWVIFVRNAIAIRQLLVREMHCENIQSVDLLTFDQSGHLYLNWLGKTCFSHLKSMFTHIPIYVNTTIRAPPKVCEGRMEGEHFFIDCLLSKLSPYK